MALRSSLNYLSAVWMLLLAVVLRHGEIEMVQAWRRAPDRDRSTSRLEKEGRRAYRSVGGYIGEKGVEVVMGCSWKRGASSLSIS